MFFRSKKILIIIAAIVFLNIFNPFSVFAAEEECPPKDGTIVLQVNIPGVTKELCSLGNAKFYTIIDANGDKKGDLTDFLALTYKFLVGIAGIAAVIMMMVGGYYWLFAGGNASKVGEAKSMISGAVLGLTLALGSYMVMNLINPDLVNWKFNPNITPPAIPKVGVATHICSGPEKAAAEKYLEGKQNKTPFVCGSVYYKNFKVYEDCLKLNPKDSAIKCREQIASAYQNGCMEVYCKPSPTLSTYDFTCAISFDEEDGNLTSGQCIKSADLMKVLDDSNEVSSYSVDTQIGKSCGSVEGKYVFNDCASLEDNENTCAILLSKKWTPFFSVLVKQAPSLSNILGTPVKSIKGIPAYKVMTVYHNNSGTKLVGMSSRKKLVEEMSVGF